MKKFHSNIYYFTNVDLPRKVHVVQIKSDGCERLNRSYGSPVHGRTEPDLCRPTSAGPRSLTRRPRSYSAPISAVQRYSALIFLSRAAPSFNSDSRSLIQ